MLRKRKKVRIICFILLFVAICVSIFISVVRKPLKGKENIKIKVEIGESFYNILDKLKESNNLKSKPLVKLYIRGTKTQVEIIPGEYIISSKDSLTEIINLLNEGPNDNVVKVTIPEGYSVDDIAKELDKVGVCKASDFIKAVKSYPLPDYIKSNDSKRYNLEGFLFPDTYRFTKNDNANDIISTMLEHFESQFESIVKGTNVKLDEDVVEKIITVASIIEKEAQLDNERSRIASVIYNRISIDMMLQIDATVIYALGEHVDIVTHKNLEIESPYNTYRNYGLPVGPISNPGAKSIEAALKPENTDYLFYVLQEDGAHYFTDNIDDFYNKQDELGY